MTPALVFDITRRGTSLFARVTEPKALRVFPRSPTEFFYRAVEASITFEIEGETVKALVLHQNGADVKFRRLAEPPPADEHTGK